MKFILNLKLKHWMWISFGIILLRLLTFEWEERIGINIVYEENDYSVYAHASNQLAHGASPYAEPYYHNLRYLYLPFLAYIITPLNALPFWLGKAIFLLIYLVALWRIQNILLKILSKYKFNSNIPNFFLFIPMALVIHFFGMLNFVNGQLTILLVWSILEAWQLERQNKSVLAGVVLAIGIALKIMPLALLAFWIYEGRWKAVIYTLLALFICVLLPAISIGWENNLHLLKDWIQIIDPGQSAHFSPGESETQREWQGLSAIAAYFFGTTHSGAGFWFLQIVRILVLIIALFAIHKKPFLKTQNEITDFKNLAIVSACIPLIFPHQRNYDWFFLISVFWYLILILANKPNSIEKKWYYLFLIYAIVFCAGRDFLGSFIYRNMLIHRIFSYMAVGFLIQVYLINKKLINGKIKVDNSSRN